MVRNPLSNEGDEVSNPSQGRKILHTAGQLSPCATTREKPV